MLSKIVSGGQTGVDRAALDFAIAANIPHGGWCPLGRLASDGPLAERYQLTETESAGYRQRTKRNVRDSDATLIINTGELDGGTLQTLVFARKMLKPHLIIQLDEVGATASAARVWLAGQSVQVLNIAGPRDEKRAGIYVATLAFLHLIWRSS